MLLHAMNYWSKTFSLKTRSTNERHIQKKELRKKKSQIQKAWQSETHKKYYNFTFVRSLSISSTSCIHFLMQRIVSDTEIDYVIKLRMIFKSQFSKKTHTYKFKGQFLFQVIGCAWEHFTLFFINIDQHEENTFLNWLK